MGGAGQDDEPTMIVDAPDPPSDWVVIATSASGSKLSVRKDSIKPGDLAPKVWVRSDFNKSAPDGAAYYLQRISFSCSFETFRTLNLTSYHADGTVVSNSATPTYEQKDEPLIPGSVIERISTVVCAVAQSE